MKLILFSCISMTWLCCTTPQEFQSPMYGSAPTYKTIPAVSDSIKTAVYGNVALSGGWTNVELDDMVGTAHVAVHVAHCFKNIQLVYGINAGGGKYYLRQPAGDTDGDTGLLFNNLGFSGGMNIVHSFPNGDEWRILCFEYSMQQDRGEYFKFRNNLEYTGNVELIDKNRNHHSFSLGTEFFVKLKQNAMSFKFGSTLTRKIKVEVERAPGYYFKNSARPYYLFGIVTARQNRSTFFFQGNIGYNLLNAQLGLCYQLR